jgi:DNA-binding GntR family transcriptional regulator
MAKNSKYLDVYFSLKRQIRLGKFTPGDFLPIESKLEELFGVSRTTVRKAVEMLAAGGYLEVKQGRGTRVLDYHYTQDLNHVTSVSETLRQKGYNVTTKSIHIDTVGATKQLAEKLNTPVHSGLYRIQRVLLADNKPSAVLVNYVNMNLTPGLGKKAKQITGLYKFLESAYNLVIDVSKNTISAKNADFTEANLLDIDVGAALLIIDRVTYGSGIPITCDYCTIRADIYQLEFSSSGR